MLDIQRYIAYSTFEKFFIFFLLIQFLMVFSGIGTFLKAAQVPVLGLFIIE